MNSWTRPNGMVTQFDWYAVNAGADALGLKEIHHIGAGATAGTTVSKFGYSYDLAGRIKSWSRQIDPAPANKKDWAMSYSRAGELTGVVEKNASSVETSRKSWSYDPAGNWYATGDSNSTTHRTHDSMNRLNQIGGSGKTMVEGTLNEAATVSVSGQAAQVASVPGTNDFNFRKEIPVTEGNNNFQITATDRTGNPRTQNYSVQVEPAQKTYEYDLNGNLLREKDPVGTVIRSFEWDGADRIKAVNWGSQRIEWTYNGLGQRVLETVNGVASKRFLWDGIDLLLEKDPAHTITKKFYGDGEQRIGGSDAGNYFYTRDHLGSVREVVKEDGTLQARYDYDAYGKRSAIYQNAAYLGGCSFGYTGHITLSSLAAGQSELLLTHYRIYDPGLGRWLSADPLGEAGGLNLYGYVGGHSINAVDPDGLILQFVLLAGDGNTRFDRWLGDSLHNTFGSQGSGSYVDGVARSSAAMMDGVIPLAEPMKNRGDYDPCDDGMQLSNKSGEYGRDVLMLFAAGTNFSGKINNWKFRIGKDPGAIRWGKDWNKVINAKNWRLAFGKKGSWIHGHINKTNLIKPSKWFQQLFKYKKY